MTDIKTPKDQSILVPVDFSESSENAIDYAMEMAKLFEHDLTLLNVISKGMKSLFLGDTQKDLLREGINVRLQEYKKNILEKWPEATVNILIKEGKPYKVINQTAEDLNCDSVVMGTNGANGMEQFVGSTTTRVISSSTVPVIAVKDHRPNHTFDHIVLPIDLTKSSKQKLSYAIKYAKKYDSTIHVIMELEKDEFAKHKVEANLAYVNKVLGENDVKFSVKLLDDRKYPDHLGKDTVRYADEIGADLIMIMTQAEGNLTEFFVGSYAKQVINSSISTPVMAINPKKTFSYEGLNL
ncbi:MAG: universal stress protein [Bacteroidia bacterium]|nr:universal stress protein [Bacteroidia bacterium]